MTACEQARERMQERLDGAMLPLDRAAFDAHLERCDGCRSQQSAWARVLSSLDELPEAEVPEGFAESVMADLPEMLPAKEGPRHVLGWGVAVAALVSAFAASLALLVNESGPDVARQTLEPLAASLHLGGMLLAQSGTALAAGLAATSQAMASTGPAAKLAFVVTFAGVNALLLLLIARLRPVESAASVRR